MRFTTAHREWFGNIADVTTHRQYLTDSGNSSIAVDIGVVNDPELFDSVFIEVEITDEFHGHFYAQDIKAIRAVAEVLNATVAEFDKIISGQAKKEGKKDEKIDEK